MSRALASVPSDNLGISPARRHAVQLMLPGQGASMSSPRPVTLARTLQGPRLGRPGSETSGDWVLLVPSAARAPSAARIDLLTTQIPSKMPMKQNALFRPLASLSSNRTFGQQHHRRGNREDLLSLCFGDFMLRRVVDLVRSWNQD
jgi:hypothetical protein